MNNSIVSVFTYTDKEIRTIIIDGAIWFVAKDICEMLEIDNHRNVLARLPESMKGVHTVDTLGGPQQMAIINEAGVYKLAFTSRKPEAEAFTDFVAGTILPTIRKTGQYSVKPMTHLEILAAQSQALVDQDRRVKALETKVERITEVLTAPAELNWEDDINSKVRMICKSRNLNYQMYWRELYIMLESVAHADLSARKRNMIERMKAAGCKAKDYNSVSKIKVIASDPQLKAIFEGIIRNEMIKHAVLDVAKEKNVNPEVGDPHA